MVRLASVLLLSAVCACGQEMCRNGLFADDQKDLRPARVGGSAPAALYKDSTKGCPQKGPECRTTSALAPGTEVLVSKINGGFACVWQSHDVVGWLPAAAVGPAVAFDRNPPLSSWGGEWRFFDNSVTITPAPDGRRLHVAGQAFWHGINSTHDGSIEFDAAPSANHLSDRDKDSGCEVQMTLVGRRLIVSDNRRCGGMNVTFAGVYEPAPPPFQTQAASSLRYGRNNNGEDTVDITNTTFELAQVTGGTRLILSKTHSEHNVIDSEGNEPKITVEAWPLGVNPKEKPLYRIALDGNDAAVAGNALLVFDRTQEAPFWSVYHLDSGKPFFDTHARLLHFSITPVVQTDRYAGLEISNDDTKDARLKGRGAVGLLTYASPERIIRQAVISCDDPGRAAVLHSLADTSFELAWENHSIRVVLTPFQKPAVVIMIPVAGDDLDVGRARIPAGLRVTPIKP